MILGRYGICKAKAGGVGGLYASGFTKVSNPSLPQGSHYQSPWKCMYTEASSRGPESAHEEQVVSRGPSL